MTYKFFNFYNDLYFDVVKEQRYYKDIILNILNNDL